jgi:hypothetical protein
MTDDRPTIDRDALRALAMRRDDEGTGVLTIRTNEALALLDALDAAEALAESRDVAVTYWINEHEDRVAERDSLGERIAAVRALHTPYRIYDECDCTPEQKDADEGDNHVAALDIGITCALMYVICRECCCDGTDREYQTEVCVLYHETHTSDTATICATVRALDEGMPESVFPSVAGNDTRALDEGAAT